MRTRKQKIVLSIKITAAAVLLLAAALFVFRNELLNQTIAKVSFKMASEYNSTFTIKEASFVGLSDLSFSEIILVPKKADTLFHIHKMKTSVNLWRLLVGDIQLGTLEIENGYVQLVKNKKGRNFDAFLKRDKDTSASNEKRDYAQVAYRLI